MSDDAKAWGDFWANNSSGGGAGCLPERWAAIEEAQRAAWRDFVKGLSDGARILDLATGDGRVLRWMHEERADLALTGIDLAPTLPPAPQGTETRGGVAMEDLPFADDSFDAVASQFGFEYGESAKVAREITRILAPGGKVGLMVHRGDGPILEHNRTRTQAIQWALGEVDVANAVTKALEAPGAGPTIASQVAAAVAKLGAAKFGETSPAWEIPEAIRRACVMGEHEGTASILQTIGSITDQAANEVGRIESLSSACARADDRTALLGGFEAGGLRLERTETIAEPSGRSLADFLTLS